LHKTVIHVAVAVSWCFVTGGCLRVFAQSVGVVLLSTATTVADACKTNEECLDVSTICWKPLRRCISCTTLCAPGRPTKSSCANQPRCNNGI